MRVLVVDDDRALRDALRRSLTLSGYEVHVADGGAEGLAAFAAASPDVVLIDLMMPGVDGLEVCRRLRADGHRTPILMLTARDSVLDRVGGLDAGADDYLVKPFDVDELKARVRALLRRSSAGVDGDLLRLGALELHRDKHAAVYEGREAELTRTEYQLLEVLMLNPRRVLTSGGIYERVWGYDPGPGSNSLRVYIGYLRRKLSALGAPELIRTVRGVGYMLDDPARRRADRRPNAPATGASSRP